ncbi:unnamed protein product [Clonostachys byssicola]|uniref:Uncharacterized protein n=1 Tax=Clonostachys byssicola TaxID=160290 RepID=A0A9N9URK6_9HYPO|nr:unnamed protein product [Clonostachys byssicola]
MASAKSNDTVMAGTAESAIDRLRNQLRSDIKARFKGQMPRDWPKDFYERPFLYYFAETFLKVCSLERKEDRVVVMEELKPTFSELESALKLTARNLKHQAQDQDPEQAVVILTAAFTFWEKINEMNKTLEAVKSGEAHDYLMEYLREFNAGLAQEASVKRESHAAVDEKQNGPEPKEKAPAKQTDIQASQSGTRKQGVSRAVNET